MTSLRRRRRARQQAAAPRAASIGLTSKPSFSASSRNAGSRHIAMKARLQRGGAVCRDVGRRRERQRHEERQLGELDQRQRVGVARELAPGRQVGELLEARGAAELQQRAKRVPLPQVALAGLHRAEPDHLAVELARLHGVEHRRRAGIAAHQLDVEAERLAGDQREDQVARRRIVAAERDRDVRPVEIGGGLRRMRRVDQHHVGVVGVGRQAAEPGELHRIEIGVAVALDGELRHRPLELRQHRAVAARRRETAGWRRRGRRRPAGSARR